MSDQPKKPQKLPVINLDADPQNANWLRILAQRRAQQAPPQPQSPLPYLAM